jgi:hypothetical protein
MSKRDDAQFAAPGGGEPLYPCDDCGTMRTKAEGGTTFTVCDACWEKHYRPTPAPASGEERCKWCDRPGNHPEEGGCEAAMRDDIARLTRELEEARGRENHALARLDAARAELAEARAEVTRLREAGKQFAEEIEHGCLACCGDGCEGAHVDDTREAIATFRRALTEAKHG